MKPALKQTLMWVSIGLNVAFAAGLTTAALFPSATAETLGLKPEKHNRPGEVRDGGRSRGGADWFLMGTIKRLEDRLNLTEAQQAAMEEQAEAVRWGGKAAMDEMRRQRTLMIQTLLLHPEDDVKVEAVKTENRLAWNMFSDDLTEDLRDVVLILTPEQRALLAEELEKSINPPEPAPPADAPRSSR